LIELLVALAISLVLALATVAAYLSTRETQRVIDESSDAQEAATYALRVIGRDVMNAGFYPAVRLEDPTNNNVLNGYSNITGRAAYEFGLFGCDGGVFDPTTGACPAPTPGAPDSIVVGYFTSDAFGTSIGQRADCAGNDVGAATAAFNAGRLGGAAAGFPPQRPLFVANHYALQGETEVVEGRTTGTRALACNGSGAGNAAYVPIINGVDDLQVTYGVFDDDSLVVRRFHTATEVNALTPAVINGVSVGAWGRVAAVRICVIGRTHETPAAVAPAGGTTLQFQDCTGALVNQAATDRSIRRTYIQVFGIRNRQTASY
jgi:type IV pilus assembly protein PilW